MRHFPQAHIKCFGFLFGKTWLISPVFILLLNMISFDSRAQEQWEKEGEGEIKDVEIEIVKDRKIVLPRASRNFDKVPPRPYEPIKPAITYEFRNFKFATPDYKPSIRPLKLKGEELSKIYGNYLSAGVGNYASFFVEGSITTKRDKNKFMGAHLYNRSFGTGPVDGKKSAASNTLLEVFGKSMGKDITVSGEGKYTNRGTYFYGFTPVGESDRDKIRQTYTQFDLNAGIENTRLGDFNYSLKAGYSNLTDHYQATEDEVSLAYGSSYSIDEKSKLILNADYFLISRKDSLVSSSPRHLFRIKPAYQFSPVDKLILTAGANIAVSSDQYPGSKNFHLYPNVKAQYELSPSMEAYGIVTGDMDKVNLHTLSAENIWIAPNINIYNTNRSLEFSGGLKGKIGRKMAMNVGVTVSALKNFYFYQNGSHVSSTGVESPYGRFFVRYDGNTKFFNPFAEISFAQAQTVSLSLRGDYFNYRTEDLPEPLHRPTYRFTANSHFNIYDKIVLDAGFIAQGGMKSDNIDITSFDRYITLAPAFDLNFKGRYFISKQVSAFVQLNNMLSSKYSLYQDYPVRGFQALVGASWSF